MKKYWVALIDEDTGEEVDGGDADNQKEIRTLAREFIAYLTSGKAIRVTQLKPDEL